MIKTLAKSVREYKKPSILTAVFVSLEVVLECLIPFVIARLVNQLKAGCALGTIVQYGIVLIAMAGVSLSMGALAGSYCATASCGFAKNLRHDLFGQVQNFSFENIDKFSTSSLVTRLTTDVANVQMAYMMIIRMAIRAPLMLIFAFTMAFLMGGKMAYIFVVVVPLLGGGLYWMIKKAMPLFRKVFVKYDNLNNSIQENIKGMRVVKSFVREDYEKKKFDAAASNICADFTQAERIMSLNGPLMQSCMFTVMLFVLYFGSYLIISSMGVKADVGQLSSMLTYSFQILTSLMMVAMVLVMLVMAEESAERIAEVLTEQSSIREPEHPVREVADGSIDFSHVYFKYSKSAKRNVLEDINLHIASGETIGIIGGTGTSKSSLIQLISRLYDVSAGSVQVGGHDVREYDLTTLRNQVAVVLQKNVLFSGTILENMRWGNAQASLLEIQEVCRLAQADEFIERFPDGYDTHIEQGGSNVSGGQKQRLCIARALLKKPKILILDDSTSAVDTRTDALIRKGLREYLPETTKLIIAQRTASVEDADRILVMDGGRVNAIGTHAQLIRENAIYREVYESQNKAGREDEEE